MRSPRLRATRRHDTRLRCARLSTHATVSSYHCPAERKRAACPYNHSICVIHTRIPAHMGSGGVRCRADGLTGGACVVCWRASPPAFVFIVASFTEECDSFKEKVRQLTDEIESTVNEIAET